MVFLYIFFVLFKVKVVVKNGAGWLGVTLIFIEILIINLRVIIFQLLSRIRSGSFRRFLIHLQLNSLWNLVIQILLPLDPLFRCNLQLLLFLSLAFHGPSFLHKSVPLLSLHLGVLKLEGLGH